MSTSEIVDHGAGTSNSIPPNAPAAFDVQYKLTGQAVGKGAFGVVCLCEEKRTNDTFACKIISKSASTPARFEAMRTEINIMRRVAGHPNVVTLKDAFESTHFFHIVMYRCTGGTLLERLKAKGRYRDREAAFAMQHILLGIHFCHGQGVIHRDLKPDNIIYVDDSVSPALKIIDFGLSTADQEVTDEKYGPQADIWSAGVILYSLLFGFQPDIEHKLSTRIRKGLPIIEKRSKISEGALDLLQKMLEPEASSRVTTTQALEHPWMENVVDPANLMAGNTLLDTGRSCQIL
ncbi:calcium-dependent protein kinase 32-like [Bidens hawaiensis]|uniref:calcium-dependent protein kinase 32-like n=1 Tax=Bidens hawaiensis TaxID=980011 RepID=UPI00404B30A4